MSNVKLGIRVRPFTERELRSDKEGTSVVSIIDDNTVTITNVKVSVSGAGDSRPRVRRYSVDYAFNSACSPSLTTYASQEKVYDKIGREVVDSVSRGCSACVLAYGQSATGKTYTMMGTDAEPGLVPRICQALGDVDPIEITVSFLEIYNERVHDLLAGESAPPTCYSLPRRRGNARKDLRVREHPARGTYVQNLRRVAIHSVEALLSLVREGSKRRRTAATRRNSTSSRSHALLELATPNATLHLADLAGSEKAGWEGCGGRQKEGANINKSLVALSNVISALVSGGNGRGRFVPYRDSALTWLLKDCFTGGASTFIIATVSPSVACYGESASTLRWAACARQLPTISSGEARQPLTRAILQAQYNQLLAELSRNYIRYVPETGKIFYDENHWKIYNGETNSPLSGNKTANIGNIMNLLHPKADGQSESTTSSAASGSSDKVNTMDKNIKLDMSSEIAIEVDKLFVPALERTQSNTDLQVIAPLRHKRRQYRSQEILPIEEDLNATRLSVTNILPSHREAQMLDPKNLDKEKTSQIPILYDSQRAEIVQSVTERLYNKIKKKEEAAASKMESVIDKKIIEPLNELRICTNARQRLVELSQKALKNKRRIGIPAHTQTRKIVTRVRDQCIGVQTDLETYFNKNKQIHSIRRDAATETLPMTPRCKEIAVGSKYGTLNFHDRSTVTEEKKIVKKSSLVMTDVVRKCDRYTQTQVVAPPRRRKRNSCCKCTRQSDDIPIHLDERTASIISINISQAYPLDSESQSSDENSDSQEENNVKPSAVHMPPDLLTNHNTADSKLNDVGLIQNHIVEQKDLTLNKTHQMQDPLRDHECENIDFSDTDDCSLPRVTVNCLKRVDTNDMKDMILGRNENIYPYNIVLSPPRERDQTKVLVKFSNSEQNSREEHNNLAVTSTIDTNVMPEFIHTNNAAGRNITESPSLGSLSCSESTESSKADSFVWKKAYKNNDKCNKAVNSLGHSFTPVYKSKGLKYAKAKAKIYREFLGLDTDDANDCASKSSKSSKDVTSSDSTESRDMAYNSFRRKRNYLEDKLTFKPHQEHRNSFTSLEQELLKSCNSLEICANKYDSYMTNYQNGNISSRRDSLIRTPTEYLQHLVQLRREVVKGEYETDGSFVNLP